MPRPSKGPRLYLRAGRIHPKTGKPIPDVYFIRDGSSQVSTGCGPDRLPDAERALAAYIASKWAPEARTPDSRSDPAQVLVDDVLALYAKDRAPQLGIDAVTLAGFIESLLTWWTGKTLSEVKRSTCKEYVAWRTSQRDRRFTKNPDKAPFVSDQTAARELDTLSGAIGWWNGEDTLTARPVITKPEQRESPRDALTRDQAAALLKAAMGWRWTPPARGKPGKWVRLGLSARRNRAHLRRFILIGLYTGSRPGVAPKLLWHESPTQAWVDLDRATIYRRGKAEREHKTKRRTLVRLPDRLVAHLRRWKAADDQLQADRRAAQKAAGEAETFTLSTVLHHGGHPLAGRVRRGFAAVVADAGLPPEITPHWMRHTAATWLMEADVEGWEAAGYLGMTVATLEKHYGHHRPDHQSAARSSRRRTR